MAEKNPLDDMVKDLVVFKHEDPNHPDGHYFSNNPLWGDSRIREHWMSLYSEEALAGVEDDADEEVEDVEGDDYETWTNDALRTELVNRELSVDGKKVDLIARLREDDQTEQE